MSHKKKRNAPVPRGNQPKLGPQAPAAEWSPEKETTGAPQAEQDPKRRLGNYQTSGEHAIQQPGGKKDANH